MLNVSFTFNAENRERAKTLHEPEDLREDFNGGCNF